MRKIYVNLYNYVENDAKKKINLQKEIFVVS